MLVFKTLKHKQLHHTYGNFLKDFRDEIFYSEIPRLFPRSMTMERLKEENDDYPNAVKQLDDYQLIEIQITPTE